MVFVNNPAVRAYIRWPEFATIVLFFQTTSTKPSSTLLRHCDICWAFLSASRLFPTRSCRNFFYYCITALAKSPRQTHERPIFIDFAPPMKSLKSYWMIGQLPSTFQRYYPPKPRTRKEIFDPCYLHFKSIDWIVAAPLTTRSILRNI